MPTPSDPAAVAASCEAAPANRTTGAVSFFRHVGAVAWKDLRVELRSREIVYTMAFFAALLVVVFSFALSQDGETIAAVAPGIVWTSVALAGTIGLGRAFDREREGDTMRALLLTPASRLGVFLGKALGIAVLILLVDVVVVPAGRSSSVSSSVTPSPPSSA